MTDLAKQSTGLPLIVGLLLILATVGVFWQVVSHDFVNYDDTRYVTQNPKTQGGLSAEGAIWAFTTGAVSNWHPLTWLSHMLDCHIFGLDPRGHHLTNVVFHAGNTLLLFFLFRFMTGATWKPAMAAALFGLHPLHAESVAWVSERKDVLSTCFWLLTMLAYAWYVRGPELKRYLLVVLAFALGLMAKPMLVTLPFVLLLMDYWPLKRFGLAGLSGSHGQKKRWDLVWEKSPLFLLSLISSIITFQVQKQGLAVQTLELIPLGSRIANALVSYGSYLWKTIWPAHLAVYYPHPMEGLPTWQILSSAFFLLCISAFFFWERRKRPYLIVGWLWFLGTLVPVIGLVQVGGQAMADRYTYVPLIGLFISLSWAVDGVASAWPRSKSWLVAAVGLIIFILGACTWFQLRHWKNTMSLFKHALEVTEGNQLAHNQFGLALLRAGKTEEAIVHFSEALRITPQYVNALVNLGNAFKDQGKLDESALQYRRALNYAPEHVTAINNLGILLAMRGKTDEAVSHFSRVLDIDPDNARAHNNMGIALAKEGKFDEAVHHFSEALRIDPHHASARKNLQRAQSSRDSQKKD